VYKYFYYYYYYYYYSCCYQNKCVAEANIRLQSYNNCPTIEVLQ